MNILNDKLSSSIIVSFVGVKNETTEISLQPKGTRTLPHNQSIYYMKSLIIHIHFLAQFSVFLVHGVS